MEIIINHDEAIEIIKEHLLSKNYKVQDVTAYTEDVNVTNPFLPMQNHPQFGNPQFPNEKKSTKVYYSCELN